MEKESVGHRIKRLRKEKKISVNEIAKQIGVSRSNFYRYESDEINKMPYTTLVPIAKILGVSPAYLLTGKSDSTGKESNNYNKLVDNLKNTIGDIELTATELKEITTFVEFMILKRK